MSLKNYRQSPNGETLYERYSPGEFSRDDNPAMRLFLEMFDQEFPDLDIDTGTSINRLILSPKASTSNTCVAVYGWRTTDKGDRFGISFMDPKSEQHPFTINRSVSDVPIDLLMKYLKIAFKETKIID